MGRARDPNREKAYQIWKAKGGKISLKDIADKLGLSDGTVRGWKNKDSWNEQLNGTFQKIKRNVQKNTERPKQKNAPKGNKYAVGNKGNSAPKNQFTKRNTAPVTHGLFRKYLPDDEETREIYDSIGQMNSLDLLWENIQIKFTAIVRAQKIMFVRDRDDITKNQKKIKGELGQGEKSISEIEWEFQYAWDKQASFLNAQARSMGTLTSMIRQYEEMCRLGLADEEQRLRIEKLKAEVKALSSNTGEEGVQIIDDIGSGPDGS